MVNIQRLREALAAKNIKVDSAAQAIGMNPSTFYRRLQRDGVKFTVDEVQKLSDLLKLSAKDLNAIFFSR